MTVRPKFHWQFEEREGSTARDSVSGVVGQLNRSNHELHGRIGHAVRLREKGSRINLGEEDLVDVTIALAMAHARQGEPTIAAEMLTAALEHPAAPKWYREVHALIRRFVSGLRTQLGADTYQQ